MSISAVLEFSLNLEFFLIFLFLSFEIPKSAQPQLLFSFFFDVSSYLKKTIVHFCKKIKLSVFVKIINISWKYHFNYLALRFPDISVFRMMNISHLILFNHWKYLTFDFITENPKFLKKHIDHWNVTGIPLI